MRTIMKRIVLICLCMCLVGVILFIANAFVHRDLLTQIGVGLFFVGTLGTWISSAFTGEDEARFAKYEDGTLKTPTGDRGQLPLGGYYNHSSR
jgi:hypothetical protein